MKYDITFHPSWWHKNAGVDFTQDFLMTQNIAWTAMCG